MVAAATPLPASQKIQGELRIRLGENRIITLSYFVYLPDGLGAESTGETENEIRRI